MRDLGELTWFLGIRIIRDRAQRKLWLCQDSYIEKITKTFHLEDLKPPKTPMKCEELRPSDEKATPQDIYRYQRKVGSLLYATTTTRPDAARTANKLSEFLRNPLRITKQQSIELSLTFMEPEHWLLNTRGQQMDRRPLHVLATWPLRTTYSPDTVPKDTFLNCSEVQSTGDRLSKRQ